ncbi:MAG: hypothetical protein P1T08_04445 [Acidimicrobiia bacterium]|nr:hypothetical protein [Acidimicrobiia bacterium]
MPESERRRPPFGYILTLTIVGLYLTLRAVEGVICVGDWLFDWGTCPW